MHLPKNTINAELYALINGGGHNYNVELPIYLERINKNIKAYCTLIKMKFRKRKHFFKEILLQIYITKNHWCHHMVRHRKPQEIKEIFNDFFTNVLSLIKTIENSPRTLHIERKFVAYSKYTGLLHREIGFPRNETVPEDFELCLQYDNCFCSWNANNDVHKISHIREGNRYNIRITAKAIDEDFGFYITGFNRFFNKIFHKKYNNITNEDEVVFRLTEKAVLTTEKIPLNI